MADELPRPRGRVVVGRAPLPLDELLRVADGGVTLELDSAVAQDVEAGARRLGEALRAGVPVYGVTTGFGSNCGTRFEPTETAALGAALVAYHGCGVGSPLPRPAVRGALLARLLCFRHGVSGVSLALVQRLADLLTADIIPWVPSQGSVGASGDLTPMSYVAAVVQGERHVLSAAGPQPAAQALAAAGLAPLSLGPKEPLALMNGTAIMTGVALTAFAAARRVAEAAELGTALAIHALGGHAHHLHPTLFARKPLPGLPEAGARLRAWLEGDATAEAEAREALQDPYSLRCAPHVIAGLTATLQWVGEWLTVEANGVDDNPIIDPADGAVLMGGNFYGGHVAHAMDATKSAVASVADLADRQLALLVDPRTSRGLPAGLSPRGGPHHGFKAVQITASALTAEALQRTMPSASFSRSTEAHNQDKVSMGSIAARDAAAVAELAAGVVACHLLAGAQGAELRGGLERRPRLAAAVRRLRALAPAVDGDRALDGDLSATTRAILGGTLLDGGG